MRLTQRQIIMALLGLMTFGSLLITVSYALLGADISLTALPLLGALFYGAVLIAYAYGWDRARYLAVIGTVLMCTFLLPEPWITQEISLAIFVPPILALILAESAWVIGSIFTTLGILVIRGGGDTVYLGPVFLVIMSMIVGGMILSRLIVEQQARELERQRDALRFQAHLLEMVDQAIIATDAQGVITYWNRFASLLYGWSATDTIGRRILNDTSEGETDSQLAELVAALNGRGRWSNEILVRRRDGTAIPVMVTTSPVHNSNATAIIGHVSVSADITERKRIEQLKNEFIATVSHELRTPLTSIRGAIGLLTGGIVGEIPRQAKEMLDIALRNSERLVRLINDMLDIEKIESGRMTFNMKPLDVMPLIRQALDANYAYGAQFGVTFVIEHSLLGGWVHSDADRLMQVFANLLSNAAKFSHPGEVVSINVTRHKAKGAIRVAITDRGDGIPEEFQSRIFQKFAQADSSDTRRRGGSGLGLSIVKAIVDRLGGHVGFETAAGVGTTFYVDLPEYPAGMIVPLAREHAQAANMV